MFTSDAPPLPASVLGKAVVQVSNRQVAYRPDFAQCLSSPAGRQLFRTYLESTLAAENLQFWEEVEVFRASGGDLASATKIYDNYVSNDAPYGLNIDPPARRSIEQKLKETITPNFFDTLQDEIYRLMADDKWVTFRQSPVYAAKYTSVMQNKEISVVKIAVNLLILIALVAIVYHFIPDV